MVSLSDFVSWKSNADVGSCNALQMPVRPYQDQRGYDCLQDVDFLCRLSCGPGLGGCVDEGFDYSLRCESESNLLEIVRERAWGRLKDGGFSRLQFRQLIFLKESPMILHLPRSVRMFQLVGVANPQSFDAEV